MYTQFSQFLFLVQWRIPNHVKSMSDISHLFSTSPGTLSLVLGLGPISWAEPPSKPPTRRFPHEKLTWKMVWSWWKPTWPLVKLYYRDHPTRGYFRDPDHTGLPREQLSLKWSSYSKVTHHRNKEVSTQQMGEFTTENSK